MSDFLNYWDTRIDANERFFNNYPHIANFAFSECQGLWDHMESEKKAILARVARLEGLVQTLLDEDPNETIADNGSTVLCAWRYDARRALEEK